MDKQFKFQWSSAKSNGEILVVRGDDWTPFKGDVDIARIWLNNENLSDKEFSERTRESAFIDNQVDPKKFVDHTKRVWNGLTFEDLVSAKKCPECGEDAWFNEGVSKKTGKPYKNLKCKKDDGHITWGA